MPVKTDTTTDTKSDEVQALESKLADLLAIQQTPINNNELIEEIAHIVEVGRDERGSESSLTQLAARIRAYKS